MSTIKAHARRYKNPLCRVTMEPDLELTAGLWTASKRLATEKRAK